LHRRHRARLAGTDATLTDFLRGEERPAARSAISFHLGVDLAQTPIGGSPQRPEDISANRIGEVAKRLAAKSVSPGPVEVEIDRPVIMAADLVGLHWGLVFQLFGQ